MQKKEIVKKATTFNEIIKFGKKKSNDYFNVFYQDLNESHFNNKYFGFAIGTKIGTAVVRNRIRRQLKNIVDKNKMLFPKGKEYIIMIKKQSVNYEYNILNDKLLEIIEKVNNEK